MTRETWGTYSVKDHLEDHPWAADVILYDRLVIPVPYDLEGGPDWQRWIDQGWEPAKQASLLHILKDRAYPISWSPYLQEQWKAEWRDAVSRQANREHGNPANPYTSTAEVLTRGLPSRVNAVTAVATYRSSDEMSNAISMRRVEPNRPMPVGQSTVVIGREFLIPDPSPGRREIVSQSGRGRFRR